ncbi:MAG: FeoA family protein [Calditrichota bacterium]
MTTVETPFTASFAANSGMLTLDQLPLGTRCRVVAVDETSESLLRLMEMGLIPGAEIVLERSAPFRTPLSVRLPGCTLAIRRDDAHRVMVTPLDPSTGEAAH